MVNNLPVPDLFLFPTKLMALERICEQLVGSLDALTRTEQRLQLCADALPVLNMLRLRSTEAVEQFLCEVRV